MHTQYPCTPLSHTNRNSHPNISLLKDPSIIHSKGSGKRDCVTSLTLKTMHAVGANFLLTFQLVFQVNCKLIHCRQTGQGIRKVTFKFLLFLTQVLNVPALSIITPGFQLWTCCKKQNFQFFCIRSLSNKRISILTMIVFKF